MSRRSSSDSIPDRTLGAEGLRAIVPHLTFSDHKGSSGKIGVIGGSLEYTGAPYFASIAGLRLGSDLAHVFCRPDAAVVIKSYSPELIVHPVLCVPNCLEKLEEWLPRLHAVVLGPGLGRDPDIRDLYPSILDVILKLQLLLVIDADGLFLLQQHAAKIKGYKKCILTPNAMEFKRLEESIVGSSTNMDITDWGPVVRSLSAALDGVTVVRKGQSDVISDGNQVMICSHPGSPRRCGGQGDLLCGMLGTFFYWATKTSSINASASAAYAACLLTRECSGMGFEKFGRSMVTSDIIPLINLALNRLMTY